MIFWLVFGWNIFLVMGGGNKVDGEGTKRGGVREQTEKQIQGTVIKDKRKRGKGVERG